MRDLLERLSPAQREVNRERTATAEALRRAERNIREARLDNALADAVIAIRQHR
jgi:hypothetical protein